MVKRERSDEKLPLFTEEEIRAKAYELWKARSSKGEAPEDDWKAAMETLKIEHSPIKKWVQGFWDWTGFKEKKGWDFLQLLIVPIVLVIAGFSLQEFAKQRDQIAADNKANQEILTKYLDQMAELLQNKLRNSKQDSEQFIISQSKTVTVLLSLDPRRQHLVIQFLEAANLNNLSEKKGLLFKARMSKANLAGSDLSNAHLEQTDLEKANLEAANLEESHLQGANLKGANLNGATLSGAILAGAELKNANFSGAKLVGVHLEEANLEGVNFTGADLTGSHFAEANLKGTNFTGADLRGAYFTENKVRGYGKIKNLTPEQIKKARNWKEADYDDDFNKKL